MTAPPNASWLARKVNPENTTTPRRLTNQRRRRHFGRSGYPFSGSTGWTAWAEMLIFKEAFVVRSSDWGFTGDPVGRDWPWIERAASWMQILLRRLLAGLSIIPSYRWSEMLRLPLDQIKVWITGITPDHLLLYSAPNLGPLISLRNQQVRKMLIQKCEDFKGSKAFVSAIFEFVKFPTRYEWCNIKGTVQ